MWSRCSSSLYFSVCLSRQQLGLRLHSLHQLFLQKTPKKTDNCRDLFRCTFSAVWLSHYPLRRHSWGYGYHQRLSVYPHNISKMLQLGSPNLTHNCSTMSSGNPFVFASQGQGRESQKHCRCGSLHSMSAGFFLFYDVLLCCGNTSLGHCGMIFTWTFGRRLDVCVLSRAVPNIRFEPDRIVGQMDYSYSAEYCQDLEPEYG